MTGENFDSPVRVVPRYDSLEIGVRMLDGKTVLRELLLNGMVVYEFRNRADVVDFLMQATSSLRYD